MAIGSPARDRQTPDAAAGAEGRAAPGRRAAFGSTLEYWLGDGELDRDQAVGADDTAIDGQPDGMAERLASWSVTFLALLAASLSLLGGAWALGLVG